MLKQRQKQWAMKRNVRRRHLDLAADNLLFYCVEKFTLRRVLLC